MRKHLGTLLLAGAALAFLVGSAIIDEPSAPGERSCVHYHGECVPPEFLVGLMGSGPWLPFAH